MEIRISIDKTARFLYGVLLVFFVGAMAMQFIGATTGHWRLAGLSALFILYGDQTASTWFNSLLLAFISLAAWAISAVPARGTTPRLSGHWKFLAALSLVMSVDEVASIHEGAGLVLGNILHVKGYLYFAFVIPGLIFALLLLLIYLPFLKTLPRRLAAGMFFSVAVYLTGAAGIEAISANQFFLHGDQVSYRVIASIEELLEMTGLILLLRVLLDHLLSLESAQDPGWKVRLGP